jgi:hypothetical protein
MAEHYDSVEITEHCNNNEWLSSLKWLNTVVKNKLAQLQKCSKMIGWNRKIGCFIKNDWANCEMAESRGIRRLTRVDRLGEHGSGQLTQKRAGSNRSSVHAPG